MAKTLPAHTALMNVTVLLVIGSIISLCNGVTHIEHASLTVSQSVQNGAALNILNDVDDSNNVWTVTTVGETNYNMKVELDQNIYGFIGLYTSYLSIDIEGASITTNDLDPFFVFSVENSNRYIASEIRLDNINFNVISAECVAGSNLLPSTGSLFTQRDPESAIIQDAKDDLKWCRLLRPENPIQCVTPLNFMMPISAGGNNQWPLHFTIENDPSEATTIFKYESGSGDIQSCGYSESFGNNFNDNKFNIFITGGGDGEQFIISRINITYWYDDGITSSTTPSPIVTTAAQISTNQPTQSPSSPPTHQPSSIPSNEPTMRPTESVLILNAPTMSPAKQPSITYIENISSTTTNANTEQVSSKSQPSDNIILYVIIIVGGCVCICIGILCYWYMKCRQSNQSPYPNKAAKIGPSAHEVVSSSEIQHVSFEIEGFEAEDKEIESEDNESMYEEVEKTGYLQSQDLTDSGKQSSKLAVRSSVIGHIRDTDTGENEHQSEKVEHQTDSARTNMSTSVVENLRDTPGKGETKRNQDDIGTLRNDVKYQETST